MIPFNRPFLAGRELDYMRRAVEGGHVSADGPFTRQCHELLEMLLSGRRVLLTTSCTHALELAAILLDFREGDEVILPSFTFVSTATAFVLHGATPRFADVRPDTLNIDEEAVAALITPRTRALVVMHYAGVGCAMERMVALAQERRITVIEDNAHGLLGTYQGRPLGTFGTFGALSFHETKNFSCGEGGAIILNDESFVERAEIVRQKGTNRARFFRGLVDKYTWVDIGSSYAPSDLLAAHLLAQLEEREKIQASRRNLWHRYANELNGWAKQNGVRLPLIPSDCGQAYHLFYLLLPCLEARQRMIAELRARGVYAVFHYQALHTSPMGRSLLGDLEDPCPTASRIADELIRLPFYTGMASEEQDRVIAAILEIRI